MEGKLLSDEERKCSNFVFAVLDATISKYGKAILDCGHDTDGKRVGGYKDGKGRYFLICFPCFDKYVKDNNIKLKVEDVKRTTTMESQNISKCGKC